MPIYEYEHLDSPCSLGWRFEQRQSIAASPLNRCPNCGGRVCKAVSLININTPKSNAELRDLGFTKLVRRDAGVYENVTARRGDSRYMVKGEPGTIPSLNKTISD